MTLISESSQQPSSDGTPELSNGRDDARFLQRVWAVAGIGVLTVIALLVLWVGRDVLLLTFAGILMGVFLIGAAETISKYTKLPHGLALTLFLVFLVSIAGVGGIFLAPSVVRQTEQLVAQLPKAQEQVRSQLNESKLGQQILSQSPSSEWLTQLEGMSSRILSFFSLSLNLVSGLLMILFVGLFLAITPQAYVDGTVRLVPPAGRPRCRQLLQSLCQTLRWWILGRCVAMIFVGTLTAAGLWLLEIPVALPIALMTTLLGFVPFFGPIIAAIPAVLLGFLQGPETAAGVAGLYLVVQVLEGNVLTPLVQRQAVSIPPAVTIVAIILLGVLLGPLGMALAMPLTAVLFVLVKELYLEPLEAPGADV